MGSASQALKYFNSINFKCPEHFNPADFFLDILSLDTRSEVNEILTRNRILYAIEMWSVKSLIFKILLL
jgi:hypothetical protein